MCSFDKRLVSANEVLVMGGNGVDDQIMELLSLSQMAERDDMAQKDLDAIASDIGAAFSAAKKRLDTIESAAAEAVKEK